MYEKVTFAKTFGASLGVLLLVAAIGVYGGVAYAVPVSGVGSYTVAADQIDAQDVTVHPQVDADGNAHAVIELQETTIEQLRITKEGSGFKMVVSADDTVTSGTMLIHAKHLEADGADLDGVALDPNDENVDSELSVSTGNDLEDGETVTFDNASGDNLHLESFEIETTYLVTNQISIPDLSLDIQSSGGSSDTSDDSSDDGGDE